MLRPTENTVSIVVSSTGKQQTLGSAFTPSGYYAYTLDPAADVPALLKQYAGPQARDIGAEGCRTATGDRTAVHRTRADPGTTGYTA